MRPVIPVEVLSVQYLPNADPALCHALGVQGDWRCLGLLSSDSDDVTYIALDEAGTAGIDALLDEDIQRLAWEKHGFRTGVYDTPTDAAHFGVSGIAEELTQVAPMPDANTMDRIIKALS